MSYRTKERDADEMISVVIPVFNCEKYIRRVYECIACQTCQDWELVLVDDGSVDASGSICDTISEDDIRVHVIHQENKGASMARRAGIDGANGDYLVFVDCDDVVESDYLDMLQKCLNDSGDCSVKIAACDMIAHDEGVSVDICRGKNVMLLDEYELQSRFFNYQFWGFGGKIYHRSVFDGVYFPSYTINEDYVVMAQIFNKYRKMAYLPVALYHYMNHGESLSHQRLSKRMFDEYYNKLWVRNFYVVHNHKWQRWAEAQLVETCVKLLRCVRQNDAEGVYDEEKSRLRLYLVRHMWRVLSNVHVKIGVKVLAFSLIM